jgi:hypothetical protein
MWRVDYEKPLRTGHKQGKMQFTSFSEIGTALGSRTTVSPKLFTFREAGREAGTQVSPVTMSWASLRTAAPPPCLPLGIKDLLKEEEVLLLEAFTLGFCFCFGT